MHIPVVFGLEGIVLSRAVQTGPCPNLVAILFGEKASMHSNDAMKFSSFNKNLDDS
jgi:ATP-dependent RNA/DNA helicase IGHMBP2